MHRCCGAQSHRKSAKSRSASATSRKVTYGIHYNTYILPIARNAHRKRNEKIPMENNWMSCTYLGIVQTYASCAQLATTIFFLVYVVLYTFNIRHARSEFFRIIKCQKSIILLYVSGDLCKINQIIRRNYKTKQKSSMFYKKDKRTL